MYVATARLNGPLEWFVSRKDPPRSRVRHGLDLLNPLVPLGSDHSEDEVMSVESGWFVRTQSVRFVVENPEDAEDLLDEAEPVLRSVRVASADPFQPTRVTSVTSEWVDRTRLPSRRLVERPPVHEVLRPCGEAIRVAKRLRPLARALAAQEPRTFPVYAEIILDGIAAARSDARKAVLYCAFAIEQMANARLDEAYARAREDRIAGKKDHHWRWVQRRIGGDRVVWKDPIFEVLKRQASRGWSALLVELPLYAWGRSLLDDDPAVYNQALKLQRVRNHLAHTGSPPEDEDVFDLSDMGSHLAVATAERVFGWFHEVNYFVRPWP